MKYVFSLLIALLLNCTGQTYDCFVHECFDLRQKQTERVLDPWIIYKFQAQEQTQVSSNSFFTISGKIATLKTTASSAKPIGSFVGGGNGNKAIIQIHQFNGLKLSDVASVSIVYKTITQSGGNIPYFNFSIDVDSANDEDYNTLTISQLRTRRRIIVMHTLSSAQSGPDADGFTTYTSTPSTSAWAIVGTPLLGLNQNPISYGPLNTFDYATYPNAIVLNDRSADGGLPRDLSDPYCVTGAGLPGTHLSKCGKYHTGVFINVGDSTNLTDYEFQIKSVTINSNTVTFSDQY